ISARSRIYWWGQKSLAEHFKSSLSMLQRYSTLLRKKGKLDVTRGGGRQNIYTPLPRPADAAGGDGVPDADYRTAAVLDFIIFVQSNSKKTGDWSGTQEEIGKHIPGGRTRGAVSKIVALLRKKDQL